MTSRIKKLYLSGNSEMTPANITIPPGLKKVPPFPPIAARLLSLLASPSLEIADVAKLIVSDSTFSALVLQHANSALFNFPSQIDSVDHAIALIGIDSTRELLVLHAAGAYASGSLRTNQMRSCWQHSIATAVIAQEIAKACGIFTSTAFTAGIIHDIGRLGLLAAYPKEYEQIIRTSAEQCLDILDFEREKFGVHHAEAGLLLAQRWGLPLEYHVIAGRHHDPCEGFEVDLLKIVHVACRSAQVLGYDLIRPLLPLNVDDVLAELPPSARKRIKLSPTQLSDRVERRILEYDSEEPENTPEPPASSDERQGAGDDEHVPEPQIELETVTFDHPSTASEQPYILWTLIILAVASVAAVLIWDMR